MADESSPLRRSLTLSDAAEVKVPHRRLSLPSSTSPTKGRCLSVVRLAYFRRCSCQQFEESDSHLSVETKLAELHVSKGVAISYTWGEFDREERVVGHWRGYPTNNVTLTLGAEWRLSSLKERLAQLTEAYQACWIDQLCIPQSEEKIRRTLAQMPSIYNTLPVIGLLPGSLCVCLRRAFDEYKQAKYVAREEGLSNTNSSVISKEDDLMVSILGLTCLNSNGACSWASRVWPLQEYFGCTTFLILHVNEETAPCFLTKQLEQNSDQLNDYLRPLYNRCRDEHKWDSMDSLLFLRTQAQEFAQALSMLHGGYDGSLDKNTFLAKFLLGETISPSSNRSPTFWFLWALASLAVNGRSATKEVDYILSVWVKWEQYTIPVNYRNLTARELLEDALEQRHGYDGAFFPSRAPTGLLCGSRPTFAWDPGACREGRDIRDSTDVYGPFSWHLLISSDDLTRMPLKIRSDVSVSLGKPAKLFGEWMQDKDLITALDGLVNVFSLWPPSTAERIEDRESSVVQQNVLEDLKSSSTTKQRSGLRWMIHRVIPFKDQQKRLSFYAKFRDILLNIPTEVLQETLFEIACDVLRVNQSYLQQKGVELVISKWRGQKPKDTAQPVPTGSCIGLVNGAAFEKARRSNEAGGLLTIALSDAPDTPFYEAVMVPKSSDTLVQYALLGVWLPLNGAELKIAQVGGVMVNNGDEHDALVI